MTYYDTQLRELQAQCSSLRRLEAQACELRSQRAALTQRVRALQSAMLDEQADVERLEGRSLAAFFYNVIGKMDEHLTRERQEAYAAKVKYDAAARELAGVEEDLRRNADACARLQGCDRRYEAALEEKAQAVKSAGGPAARELLRLEERLSLLDDQRDELAEAIEAGSAALHTAEDVLESLGHAENWGTWDLLGGGLISDMAKYGHLDDAQRAVEQLQSQLRRFQTELADVTVQADIQVGIGGFLQFADCFFDGLFADWAVLDQIGQSKEQVLLTRDQIERILARLRDRVQDADREQTQLQAQLDELVLSAQL